MDFLYTLTPLFLQLEDKLKKNAEFIIQNSAMFWWGTSTHLFILFWQELICVGIIVILQHNIAYLELITADVNKDAYLALTLG
jgi:hypothetical protein